MLAASTDPVLLTIISSGALKVAPDTRVPSIVTFTVFRPAGRPPKSSRRSSFVKQATISCTPFPFLSPSVPDFVASTKISVTDLVPAETILMLERITSELMNELSTAST